MVKQFSLTIIALGLLAACGNAGTADSQPAEPSQAQLAAQQVEPQVGDRIEDAVRQREREASNRRAAAEARARDLAARGVREIGWEELLPEGEEEKLAQLYQQQMAMLYSGGPIIEGSAADQMIQIGTFNTVKELNEAKIRIPGYTVPFEFGANAEIKEFLLVPYYGACLHAPPPPPNQTVFAISEEPIRLRDLAQAVWLEGTIYTQTQESELADAAYTIRIDRVETYEY